MSIVYGQNDAMLDDSMHRHMYDVPIVTYTGAPGTTTNSKSEEDVSSVLQIKEIDNANQSQTLHQNWISAPTMESSPRTPCSERSFVITAAPKPEPQKKEPKKESIHVLRYKAFRRKVRKVVNSKYFEGFIVFCILLNTLFMAIESPGMDPVLKVAVNIANIVSIYK